MISKINANDLVIIAQAAYEYLRKITNENSIEEKDFLERVKTFRNDVWKISWDENAIIYVDECPFK